MQTEKKRELIKKLEDLVSFQKDCLNSDNWEEYDLAENEVRKLEEKIIHANDEKT